MSKKIIRIQKTLAYRQSNYLQNLEEELIEKYKETLRQEELY